MLENHDQTSLIDLGHVSGLVQDHSDWKGFGDLFEHWFETGKNKGTLLNKNIEFLWLLLCQTVCIKTMAK